MDELRDCSRYVYPSRAFGVSDDGGQETPPDRSAIYDATATDSVINLLTTTQRLLIPQQRPWAEIVIANAQMEQLLGGNAAPALALANDTLAAHFTYSNFYIASGEALMDNILFGSSCLAIVDRVGHPLSYHPVPVDQIYFLENFSGHVDVVFREHTLTARQLQGRYPDSLPSNIKECADEKPSEKHRIIECAIPEGSKVRYAVYLQSDWTELEADIADRSPFIVWRWEKSLGSVWGGSPVRNALPHIRCINRMQKSVLAAAEFASLGGWQTTDETINVEQLREDFEPGCVVALAEELKPIPFPGTFNLGPEAIDRERTAIRDLLFNTSLPPQDKNSYMTATEVVQRRDQFMSRVGQPAQRLQEEFLQVVAEDAVARLAKRGDIAAPPPELYALLQQNRINVTKPADVFKVEVNAAIRQAIKLNQSQSDLQALATVSQTLMAMDPMIRAALDLPAWLVETLTNMGLSPMHLTPVDKLKAQAQQAQAASLVQQAMHMGAAGDQVNRALAPGSALGSMAAKVMPALNPPQGQRPQ